MLSPLRAFIILTNISISYAFRNLPTVFKGVSKEALKSITGTLSNEHTETPTVNFDWNKQWYPVAVENYLDSKRPNSIQLLGNDLVVWFDGKSWVTFEDRCPHRAVQLSEGRIEDNGELLCAYHAWRFDSTGKCTSIPFTSSKEREDYLQQQDKTCVSSYPTQVAQGLIWVWGEKGLPGSDVSIEAALKNLPLIEELHDPALAHRISSVKYNDRILPYGWDYFMENTLDPAHVVVSHHNIIGNRYKDPKYTELIAHPWKAAMNASSSSSPSSPAPLGYSHRPEDEGFIYEIKRPYVQSDDISFNEFRPPALNKITSHLQDGSTFILALYATPTMPGYCKHIGAQVKIRSEGTGKEARGIGFFDKLPLWLLHITSSIFLHQDMVFLHGQERANLYEDRYLFGQLEDDKWLGMFSSDPKTYAKRMYMPNPQDIAVNALRRWIHHKAGGGPRWGPAALAAGLPRKLPAKELFDTYDSHTKSCRICQKALRNVKAVKLFAWFACAWSLFSPSWGRREVALAVRGLVAAAFVAVASIASVLEGLFYSYKFSHQDNK